MKGFLSIIVMVAVLAPATHCLARQQQRQGAYASAFIGVRVPPDTDVTSTSFQSPVAFSDDVEFDPGINVGGTAGYDFGLIRLEGELSYKYSEIKSITDQTDGYQFQSPDGNLGTLAMLANLFIDLHNDSPVTPYVGAGIGFASLHLSDTYGTDSRGGPPLRTLLYASDTDTVFAWQAGGGLEVALNRQFSLDLGYRYFATDKSHFDSNGITTADMRLESHTGTVGLRIKFY